MSHKYYVFTTPSNALCQLSVDEGWSSMAIPATHPTGRLGQVFVIPDNIHDNQGASLTISSEGYTNLAFRGILTYADSQYAYMQCDDFVLVQNSVVPPPQPPLTDGPASNSPEDIISWVFNKHTHDLATHEGCGEFTEECCDELHVRNNSTWGHIKKNPGQNQYNTHAVDALQCLGGTYTGIWDIIHDSVSPNATWQFINKGPADPNLYCYPAASCGAMVIKDAKESVKKHK